MVSASATIIDRKQTFLAKITHSIGSTMFRNLFATVNGEERDLLRDGELSCAVYVSSLLLLVEEMDTVHARVPSVVSVLKERGWASIPVETVAEGDVILWEEQQSADGETHTHLGFALGNGMAVSNSSEERRITKHSITYDGRRAITEVFRCLDWSQKPKKVQ